MPAFDYKETSMSELKASVRRTIVFLKTIKPKDIEMITKKKVPLFFNPKVKVKGVDYLAHLALPDFYFHAVTAYDILRNRGGIRRGTVRC